LQYHKADTGGVPRSGAVEKQCADADPLLYSVASSSIAGLPAVTRFAQLAVMQKHVKFVCCFTCIGEVIVQWLMLFFCKSSTKTFIVL